MVNKKNLLMVLRLIVSLGLLGGLVWIMRKDLGSIWPIIKNSNKIFLIAALFINIPLTILMGLRLRLLFEGQKVPISIKDAVYLTLIGFFFNNFLPTAIGGDIAKAYYASKRTNNKIASYAAVLSDRLFGFIATMLIAAVGLIFIGKALNNNSLLYAMSFVFFISVAIIFFLFKSKAGNQTFTGTGLVIKIKEKIYKLYSAINMYRDNPPFLLKIVLLSIFMQSCAIITIYLLVLSIGGSMSFLKMMLVIPIIWSVSMLPSINGLGVREGAFVYFLKGDIGPEKAFTISLLWLGVIIAYSVTGGILHLLYPVKVKIGDPMESENDR
jgi:hypothetical protein